MKKYTLQAILLTGLFFFNLVSADYDQIEFIEFARNEVFIPERLGNIKLYKDDYGFHIFKDGEIYDVQNCFCDPLLRKMSNEQLVNFLGRNSPKIIILTQEEFSQIDPEFIVEMTEAESEKLISQLFSSGYISVNQMDNGEYILHAKIRLLGGVEGVEGVSAGGAAAAVAGVGMGGAAAVGGVAGAILGGVAAPGEAVVFGGLFSGVFDTLGVVGLGAVSAGAAEVVVAMIPPVAIAAGLTYGCVKLFQWATRSPEEPVANPPAPEAAPDEENTAPQAAPAVKIRIIEGTH